MAATRGDLWQMNTLAPVTEWVGRHVFGVDAVLQPIRAAATRPQCGCSCSSCWSSRSPRPRLECAGPATHPLPPAARLVPGVPADLLGGADALLRGGQSHSGTDARPAAAALLQPYGQLSPNWVLWLQVGSSYPYEIALGAVELAAGVLLFVPRTATLGALLALASMAEVFLINMTFEVSVKILSFQLLLISLVLLAPHAKRLANMFVLQRPSPPATQPPLFTSARANTIASGVQVAMGGWVLLSCLLINGLTWREYGGGAPKPELYGIWSVT